MNLKARLDAEFFPFVIRPARYIGNEWGAVCPQPDSKPVRMVLCVPEKYERGMGYPRLHRVYRVAHSSGVVSCERCFLPDSDAETLLREKGIPLFTLESFTPLPEMDWVHFLVSDPLSFPGVITILRSAGIPIHASERIENRLIISASSTENLNPEPIAEYLDFHFVGEIESALESIGAVLSKRAILNKLDTLKQMQQVAGVYVISGDRADSVVHAQFRDKQTRRDFFTPIQAFEEVTNDRLVLELSQSVEVAHTVEAIAAGFQETGFDEIVLSADLNVGVKNFDHFVSSLGQRLRDQHVSVQLPSLTINQYALEAARAVTFGEKQSIRFDLVSGSERLREAHGHFASLELFYQLLADAYASGWKTVRIEFALGLPEESENDLDDTVSFIRNCESVRREFGDKVMLAISVRPFVPMPYTEWQWDEIVRPEEYVRRCEYVQRRVRGHNIQFKAQESQTAYLRAIVARGDRSFGRVLEYISESDVVSEVESDETVVQRWTEALQLCGIESTSLASSSPVGSAKAWDHIDYGMSSEQLAKRRKAAFPEIDNRPTRGTFKLGDIILAKPALTEQILVPTSVPQAGNFGRRPKRIVSEPAPMIVPRSRVRLMWSKDDSVRFVGHLATMRALERAIRRAGLPVAYSQGLRPRPRLSFGPPLTLGYTSKSEFLDIQLDTPFQDSMLDGLNESLHSGFRILKGRPVFGKAASVSSLINLAGYEVVWDFDGAPGVQEIAKILSRNSIVLQRKKNDEINEIDIRGSIFKIELRAVEGVNHLCLELALGNQGFVRPDEVLSTCFGLSERDILPLRICRTALLVVSGESRLSPFEVSS